VDFTDSSPGYHFDYTKIDFCTARFLAFIKAGVLPPDETVVDRKYEWASNLMLNVIFLGSEDDSVDSLVSLAEDCATLIATCPEKEWAQRGAKNAVDYMQGRLLSAPFISRTIIRNLGFMISKSCTDQYYYETLAFLLYVVASYIALTEEYTPDRTVEHMTLYSEE